MASGFPKRLTEVYQTSDGRFWSDEAAAKHHEDRFEVRRIVAQAVMDAQHHTFGTRRLADADYQSALVELLVEHGLGRIKQ